MKRLIRKQSKSYFDFDFNQRLGPIAYINGEVFIGGDNDVHQCLVNNFVRKYPDLENKKYSLPIGFGHIMKENDQLIAVFDKLTLCNIDFPTVSNAVKQQCSEIKDVVLV